MWFGKAVTVSFGEARSGEVRQGGLGRSSLGMARHGSAGRLRCVRISLGRVGFGEAVKGGNAGSGKFRSGTVRRSWNGTVRRVTASCGGLGSVWQCKVGSGAVRFGKTVGARFGKVGMSRHGMPWIGGLG